VRVLLANKFFFRNGGSEAVMFQEREFLREAGVEVVDFSMQDPRNLPSAQSGDFVGRQSYETAEGRGARVRAALKLIHSREAVRNITRLIDRTRPDILHCHNIYHQLTPSIIGAAKRRGLPVVLTLHDYKPVCPVYTRLQHGQVCSECLGSQFTNVLKHRCADGSLGKSALLFVEAQVQRLLGSYEKVDRFVAPSEFMRQSVTQHRFAPDRVEVIYNGIACSASAPTPEDQGYALYLGRLSPEKGIETLLSAQDAIAEQVPLMVAGTGPLEQSVRLRYPKARYLGHLSGAALESTIRQASLIVVPSEWYENCPMSVLEAMALGKPVVASDIGGIPELVMHGETGLLFPPGDRDALKNCLSRLMNDSDLRHGYGAAGRRRAIERFSLEHHNNALLRLYRTLVDQTGARAARDPSSDLATPQE
jgi:glycosyltransferase involved in cell wall biosynthesis